jgi:hypothetical protein
LRALLAEPPASLQTLVDERRDALRRRRNARLDAYSGRYGPWSDGYAAYDAAIERHHDALRRLHRQERDAVRLHHDAMLDAIVPWSRPHRDWVRQRSFLRQMDQLDWQELRDEGLFRAVPMAYAW